MAIVTVYKGTKREGLYVYVFHDDALERVPSDLLAMLGTPCEVLTFELTRDRVLARADASAVLDALEGSGFYLQLPPTEAELADRHVR